MNVRELKELLQEKIDLLEGFDDNQEIKMESNTYFLGGARYFLGISGYDGGYINLAHLEEQIEDEEFEDEE